MFDAPQDAVCPLGCQGMLLAPAELLLAGSYSCVQVWKVRAHRNAQSSLVFHPGIPMAEREFSAAKRAL